MKIKCPKCKENAELTPDFSLITCTKCNLEMRLDMSLKDHRKLLKKHEKVFVGVLTPEGDVVDYTNEDNRNPEESPA